jgi:CDP-diacylglycerol--serine O-phosphatidyltransferase
MMVIKKDLFATLKQPISAKRFGKNKTWRGFVFVSIVNAFFVYIITFLFSIQLPKAAFIGFVLGFAYMLFELPNSYMKRRLGIQAGEQAKQHKTLFMLIDKMDSAFGVTLVYFAMNFISFQHAVLLFVINSSTHILVSQLLVQLRLKKSF